MAEVQVSAGDAFTKRIASVIDSKGLRVSETVLADSLRLEPFGGHWVVKFEGAVWLTAEMFAALNGDSDA